MLELLASIYAAQVAAGLMAAWPWFFRAYTNNGCDEILLTSLFLFVLSICGGRTWFWLNLEIGHPSYVFLGHLVPQLMSAVATVFLLVASSRCHWLEDKWWVASVAVTAFVFAVAQAV